jgi:(2Fe-2S) ferredoxin
VSRYFDIRVCRGPVCAGQRQADDIHAQLAQRVAARELGAVVTLDRQSCFGRCFFGPNVHVRERVPATPAELNDLTDPGSTGAAPGRVSAFYSGVRADDADEILSTHVLAGRVVERLVRRVRPPSPADVPPGFQPDVRLATALARADAGTEPPKDPEPSADVAPDPR